MMLYKGHSEITGIVQMLNCSITDGLKVGTFKNISSVDTLPKTSEIEETGMTIR